jgi:hypothetical protein
MKIVPGIEEGSNHYLAARCFGLDFFFHVKGLWVIYCMLDFFEDNL